MTSDKITLGSKELATFISLLDDPQEEICSPILQALVQLPLKESGWLAVGKKIDRDLNRLINGCKTRIPAGTLIECASRVPFSFVREKIYVLVTYPEYFESCISVLIEVGDPVSLEIVTSERFSPSLPELPEKIWETIVTIPPPGGTVNLKTLFQADLALTPRFWIAVALAERDDLQPLQLIFNEISENPDSFSPLYGSPMLFQQKLEAAVYLENSVRQKLNSISQSQEYSEEVREIAAYLSAIEEKEIPPPKTVSVKSSPEEIQSAEKAVEQVRLDEDLDLSTLQSSPLRHLPRKKSEQLLGDLVTESIKGFENKKPGPPWHQIGNGFLHLAQEFGWSLLPDSRTFEAYRAVSQIDPLSDIQIGWLVAKGNVPKVVNTLSTLIQRDVAPFQRPEVAGFMKIVADNYGAEPPFLGAGQSTKRTTDTPMLLQSGEGVVSTVPPSSTDNKGLPIEGAKLARVRLGASAPNTVQPGKKFTVNCTAYTQSFENEIKKILKKSTRDARLITGLKPKKSRWRLDALVEIMLVCDDRLVCDDPVQEHEWDGEYLLAPFDIFPKKDIDHIVYPVGFDIKVDGTPCGIIRFDLKVTQERSQKEMQTIQTDTYSSAFASYSSLDRELVMHRVSSIEISTSMNVYVDCIDLHTGEEWNPQLEKKIKDNDLFLLFWSKNAENSKWVKWELEAAKANKAKNQLKMHPLEPWLTAPEGIDNIHINDIHMIVSESHKRHNKP